MRIIAFELGGTIVYADQMGGIIGFGAGAAFVLWIVVTLVH